MIINVDDIGIHLGAVAAAIETIVRGVAASGSVMVVCPGTAAALEFLSDRPEVPVGVHLTLTADFPGTPWTALTAGASISEEDDLSASSSGSACWPEPRLQKLRRSSVLRSRRCCRPGIQPTHLDWHGLADGGREDIFELTLALAEEYGTGIRAWTDHGRANLRARGLRAQDQPFLDSFTLPLADKQATFLDRIQCLPDGMSEWALHPAEPHPDDQGAQVRLTDHELLLAASTRQVLQEEQIVVTGHGDPALRTPAAPTHDRGPTPATGAPNTRPS